MNSIIPILIAFAILFSGCSKQPDIEFVECKAEIKYVDDGVWLSTCTFRKMMYKLEECGN